MKAGPCRATHKQLAFHPHHPPPLKAPRQESRKSVRVLKSCLPSPRVPWSSRQGACRVSSDLWFDFRWSTVWVHTGPFEAPQLPTPPPPHTHRRCAGKCCQEAMALRLTVVTSQWINDCETYCRIMNADKNVLYKPIPRIRAMSNCLVWRASLGASCSC